MKGVQRNEENVAPNKNKKHPWVFITKGNLIIPYKKYLSRNKLKNIVVTKYQKWEHSGNILKMLKSRIKNLKTPYIYIILLNK